MKSTNIQKIRRQIKRHPIYMHVLSAVVVFFVIIVLVLRGLNVYTLHGQAISIPNVKGLSIEEASIFFENSGLRMNVIDSVYTGEVKPGAIVEAIPTFGSKVKKGRIVFVTINAYSAQSAAIPDVNGWTLRQAYATIKAQGFISVETKYVHGEYRDLAIGVELNGKKLEPGTIVPLSSALILNIGDGGQEVSDETLLEETETGDES
jgi:hypothetical protein